MLLPLTFLEQSSSGCRIPIPGAMTHLCSPYHGECLAAAGLPFRQEKAKLGPKQIRMIPQKQTKIIPQTHSNPPNASFFKKRFLQATGAFSVSILGFWEMDKVTIEIVGFWGLFLVFFFETPLTSQPIHALSNTEEVFSPRGGFTPKHQSSPSAKTSLISCVGAKPN